MSKKRQFEDGVIVKFFNHIWCFLLGNFYFWILNIPFIVVELGMINYKEVNAHMIILIMISSIPIGPALTALLSIMGQLIRDGSVDVTKEFFKAYKLNFKHSLFFWTVGIIILTVAWIELIYFSNSSNLSQVGIIPLVIIFVCIALGIYIFPLISRFYMKKKEFLILSIICLFKKSYISIVAIIMAFIIWSALINIRLIIVLPLFFISIICYLIMLMEKKMLLQIEEKYNEENS